MNEINIKNTIRFALFVLIQVLVLKKIFVDAPVLNKMHLFLFPLAILLLPLNTYRMLVLGLAFGGGLFCDLFYDSPGVHAFSAVLLAYSRHFFFKWLEPRGGYGTQVLPLPIFMGNNWAISYLSLGMGLYILVYFSMQAFSPVFLFGILSRTIISFVFSMLLVFVYLLVFNPKA